MSNTENNKRIAKNTLLLYFRMFLTMGVTLYTSRIVLNTLGVEDFGIYNVVGGVAMMFSFLNASMSSATQRFLSFELGKNDFTQLKKVFSMSVNIHAIIAIAIFILAETIGLWFMNAKLNIPSERMNAANWVYQFSILSLMLTVMNVPYNATIIAHERMSVYAYISILEVSLKLLMIFMLTWLSFDKLKLYAVLIFSVTVLITLIYWTYSKFKFKECTYHYINDRKLFIILINFSGWSFFGSISMVLMDQGVNILLNIFFGPIINTARGIAYQVNTAVQTFATNFQMAINPQIVKSYASDNREYMHQLIIQSSKFSYFLLLILTLPVLLETNYILHLWLKNVPDYSIIFCRLILINTLINSFASPLMTAAQASGNIKRYYIIVGSLLILNLPISYLLLKLGTRPEITIIIAIILSILSLIIRLYILQDLISLKVLDYISKVLLKCLYVTLPTLLIPTILCFTEESGIRFITTTIVSLFISLSFIILLGMTKPEKKYLKNIITKILLKNHL